MEISEFELVGTSCACTLTSYFSDAVVKAGKNIFNHMYLFYFQSIDIKDTSVLHLSWGVLT